MNKRIKPRFDFLQGLLLMVEAPSDYTRAEACFHKSVQADEVVGAVVPAAQTRFYPAQALAQKGVVKRSRSLLTELRSEFQNWGIDVWKKNVNRN